MANIRLSFSMVAAMDEEKLKELDRISRDRKDGPVSKSMLKPATNRMVRPIPEGTKITIVEPGVARGYQAPKMAVERLVGQGKARTSPMTRAEMRADLERCKHKLPRELYLAARKKLGY